MAEMKTATQTPTVCRHQIKYKGLKRKRSGNDEDEEGIENLAKQLKEFDMQSIRS
jgi:hypothetical protein